MSALFPARRACAVEVVQRAEEKRIERNLDDATRAVLANLEAGREVTETILVGLKNVLNDLAAAPQPVAA